MTNCLKCVYKVGEPKGERACRKCGRPENVSKAEWPPAAPAYTVADLIGEVTGEQLPPDTMVDVQVTVENVPAPLQPDGSVVLVTVPADAELVSITLPTAGPDAPTITLVNPDRVADTGPDAAKAALAVEKAYAEAPPVDPPLAPASIAGAGSEKSAPETSAAAPSAPAAAGPSSLPEHSPLGGSGAKRWMNCAGSNKLIERLGLVDDESEFAKHGTLCHSLAERCLNEGKDAWEFAHEFPDLDPAEAVYVQEYIDYVHSRPGRKRYEVFQHRPELHPYMYGKVDCEIVPVTGASDLVLEIVDAKFGAGVYVDPTDNPQLKYYALLTIMEEPTWFPDEGKVRLTVAQPRLTWAGDTIRSWDTRVDQLKAWLYDELLPAMSRDAPDDFKMGEWCQFCPAKLVCPAMNSAFDTLHHAAVGDSAGDAPVAEYSDEALGQQYAMWQMVKMYGKALEMEVYKRLMEKRAVPGTKLVTGKSDRTWKDGAEAEAKAKFGQKAYTEPKLLSPAQMEKIPGGDGFVATWAYKPPAGYVVAPADDVRKGVVPKAADELHASALAKYLDAAG